MSLWERPKHDPMILAVDFDGTLAERIWPSPGIGTLIPGAKEFLERAKKEGYKVIIHTARIEPYFQEMENWLLDHKIPYDEVAHKPLAGVYIDDRGVPFKGDWAEVSKEVFGD